MADVFEETWASDDDALIDEPSAAEIRDGFRCGPASPGRFNWLFQSIMSAINGLNIADLVPKSRKVDTAEGLQGGGTLEVDRTLRLHFMGLEPETTIADEDLVAVYDVSAAKHVQMTRANLVSGLGGGGGAITGGANIGTGDGLVYGGVSGSSIQFRKIKAGDGVAVAVASNDVVISVANRGSELTYS